MKIIKSTLLLKGVQIMFIELLEEKKDFTNSEKQIADYILKNPFSITK